MRINFFRSLKLLIIAFLLQMSFAASAVTYVFATFPPNSSGLTNELVIYTSTNALNWTLLKRTGYKGPTGWLRDPSIMKYNGKYYAAFTTPPNASCCGSQSSFGIAVSTNLTTWTTLTTVKSGIANVKNTWAPEWFTDSDGSISIYAGIDTNGSDHKIYRFTAKNADLTSWSGPTYAGIGPNNIDAFPIKIGSIYHMFVKNETTKYIEHATSNTPIGPWTFVGKGNWAGWGTHREAPALVNLGNGTWRIYMDGGSAGGEMYSDGTNNLTQWTALQGVPGIRNTVSHGTIIAK